MAATIRRIVKRTPAQFSLSFSTALDYLDDANMINWSNASYNGGDGSLVHDSIWIYSKSISSLLKAKSYTIPMSSYYENVGESIYIDDSTSGDYASQTDMGGGYWDDEAGVPVGFYYDYTVPAGSYFSFCSPASAVNIDYCSYYTERAFQYAISLGHISVPNAIEYDYNIHNKIYGIYYAETDVVIRMTEGDHGEMVVENHGITLQSGIVKFVNVSVTHSTTSYSYWSQDNSDRYAEPFFSGIRFYDFDNTTPLNIWQYYEQYAYLPVTQESLTNLDPTSVALSNTSPMIGTSNSIVVTRSTSSLTYGTLTYTYQYSTNSGTSWITLGTSTNTSYSFIVPAGISQIKVRVQASDGIGTTSANYVTSANYSVVSYTSYAGVSGMVKGVSPKVCVSGYIKANVTVKKGVNGTVK